MRDVKFEGDLTRVYCIGTALVVAACSGSDPVARPGGASPSNGTGGESGATSSGGSGGGAATASVPAEIVGSWYAGSGYTSAPYDPASGTWGTPTGKGLVYLFRADGTYTKGFQSYVSNYGCTTGFSAFEEGSLSATGHELATHPSKGHVQFKDTCAPSMDSDEPVADLTDEAFVWTLRPSDLDSSLMVLDLRRDDGAQSTFVPL